MSEKGSKKEIVGIPFCIDFSTFSKTCKSIDFIVKPILLECFSLLKTFIFQSKFIVFSKPLLAIVSRGSKCRSLLKRMILVPFSIFGNFQKDTLDTIFGHKGSKGVGRFPAGSLLVATLLFTKPW